MRRKVLGAVARVKRFVDVQVAAALAHREQQVEMFAQRQFVPRDADSRRFYRSPIDRLFARTARKQAA